MKCNKVKGMALHMIGIANMFVNSHYKDVYEKYDSEAICSRCQKRMGQHSAPSGECISTATGESWLKNTWFYNKEIFDKIAGVK